MKESTLRKYIKSILCESMDDSHRCLDGAIVNLSSKECYNDLCFRIDDAIQVRDSYPLQSDSRDHYNGVLKVLRRKLRKSKKSLDNTDI